MNRTVTLDRSVKSPSGDWGTKPVSDKQLKNLEDVPEGDGKYYLAYYEGKHPQGTIPLYLWLALKCYGKLYEIALRGGSSHNVVGLAGSLRLQ